MEDALAKAAAETPDPPPRKRRLLPLLAGLCGAAIFGAGGYLAVATGLIGGPAPPAEPAGPVPDIAFVPVDPLTVTLPEGASAEHLRFTAQIEVEATNRDSVAHLMPRILDVMNGYLRAVDVATLEDPAALATLRAQLLRRIQIVTGEGQVRDLLVTEFVMN
jgi:flagellar FliL protein